ncbi:MAG TPA: helix-turn-helix transcriptional regulator [Acidimicrobiales bacterium]|nr:helix-turn-helix transcriptional regulator [Acidimicrobiales bacterium]
MGDAPVLIDLSPREAQVLDHLAAGWQVKEIGVELGITTETCRGYVKQVMIKLGAHTQLQAVLAAAIYGMLSPDHPLFGLDRRRDDLGPDGRLLDDRSVVA